MPQHVPIPNKLRYYREQKGYTQEEVDRLLNLKYKSEVCRWEKGKCVPSIMKLLELSLIYTTPIEAFYSHIHREASELLQIPINPPTHLCQSKKELC